MTDVTHDRVCLIYALISDYIDRNVGVVIFSAMKKASYHQGRRYRFGGLLTRFLRDCGVEEEALDYKPAMDTHHVDMSRTKGLMVTHGPVLTMPEHHARNDKITSQIYGLQLL